MYGWANHRITRDNLIAFAWSAPMRELAQQVGLSDVGLKKVLKSHGVAGPPQGHWNRVHAGRPVPDRPKAPARRPGERPYILIDNRFSRLPVAPLPSSAGPFASARIPEDLEQLRVQERSAIGRAVSASKIVVPHPAIRSLLARDETCHRLMSVPGVGPVTAVTFLAVIDDPSRFQHSRDVGAHLGMTPRKYASGETDRNGSISKMGDALLRTTLYQASLALLTRSKKWSTLKAWGMAVAKRRGLRRAIVAVARKLAIVMHRIWVDGTEFRWTREEAVA